MFGEFAEVADDEEVVGYCSEGAEGGGEVEGVYHEGAFGVFEELVGVAEAFKGAALHLVDEAGGAVVFDDFGSEAEGDAEVAALELDLVAEFEHSGLGGFDDALAGAFGGLGV